MCTLALFSHMKFHHIWQKQKYNLIFAQTKFQHYFSRAQARARRGCSLPPRPTASSQGGGGLDRGILARILLARALHHIILARVKP